MKERLQKILARIGIASRRKAEELILEGRVTINGWVAALGMKADPETDHIKVDGRLISRPEPRVYYILNKPEGVLTTLDDKEARPTIRELIKGIRHRVFPVGRLDYHSEGLLMLTNDGELAFRLIHPSQKIPKTYIVKVRGIIADTAIDKLKTGVRLEDGLTAPASVKRIRMPKTEKNSWLEIIIHEGRKRQIRRMLEHVGHPVLKLKRIRIDGIGLGDLPAGKWRPISPLEIQKLKRSVKISGQ